jgi:predicted DNA-binding transcriptional regulator AlpA
MATNAILPETGFVRLPTVLAVYPISRSAWWSGVKAGKYPKPVKLSERTTAWRVEDIQALIASHDRTISKQGA